MKIKPGPSGRLSRDPIEGRSAAGNENATTKTASTEAVRPVRLAMAAAKFEDEAQMLGMTPTMRRSGTRAVQFVPSP